MNAILRMYAVALACSLAAACTTDTAAIDTKIADLDAKLYKYCVYMRGASMIASTALENSELANKIDAGIGAYCTTHVTNVPDAIAKLSSIYLEAVKQGVKPSPAL